MNESVQCSIQTINGTYFGIVSKYGGIPQNLALNAVYWGVAMTIFLLIRRHIADQDTEEGRFFPSRFYKYIASPKQLLDLEIVDLNPFAIIWKTITMSLRDINMKCGADAARYLLFEIHLIIVAVFVTIVSLAVILPVNFQGTLSGNITTFGFSTISNLNKNSNYFLVHMAVNLIFIVVGYFVCLHFCQAADINFKVPKCSNTVMIRHLPKNARDAEILLSYFRNFFENHHIKDISFTYDVREIITLNSQRQKFEVILQEATEFERLTGRTDFVAGSNGYGCLCLAETCMCCKFQKINAVEYYSQKIDELTEKINGLCSSCTKKPHNIAFVTFMNMESSKLVVSAFNRRKCLIRNPPCDDDFASLKPKKWIVTFAPKPSNIIWENLRRNETVWWLQVLVLNTVMFFVAIILTTPSIILNSIDKILTETSRFTKIAVPVFIINVLPSLVLKIVASCLPILIGHSGHLERHWTYSHEMRSEMDRLFLFLLFTVLIVPSLGLVGLQGFLRWLFQIDATSQNHVVQWECVFLPDNGAFFINFIITSAFIGTSSALLRIPELIAIGFNWITAKSKAERRAIFKFVRNEFILYPEYATLAVTFSTVICYAVICPLIAPFGLVYFILKFFVDKYNIYFVSKPTFVKQRIHHIAVKFIYSSFVVQQLFLLFFTLLKTTSVSHPIFVVQLIATLCVGLFFICEGIFSFSRTISKHLSIVKRITAFVPDIEKDEYSVYQPLVLQLYHNSPDDHSAFAASAVLSGKSDLDSHEDSTNVEQR